MTRMGAIISSCKRTDKGLAGDCIKLWKHQQLATVDESQKWHIRKVYGTHRSRQQFDINKRTIYLNSIAEWFGSELEVNSPLLA